MQHAAGRDDVRDQLALPRPARPALAAAPALRHPRQDHVVADLEVVDARADARDTTPAPSCPSTTGIGTSHSPAHDVQVGAAHAGRRDPRPRPRPRAGASSSTSTISTAAPGRAQDGGRTITGTAASPRSRCPARTRRGRRSARTRRPCAPSRSRAARTSARACPPRARTSRRRTRCRARRASRGRPSAALAPSSACTLGASTGVSDGLTSVCQANVGGCSASHESVVAPAAQEALDLGAARRSSSRARRPAAGGSAPTASISARSGIVTCQPASATKRVGDDVRRVEQRVARGRARLRHSRAQPVDAVEQEAAPCRSR